MWDTLNSTCSCHGLDCCPVYEAWCDEQQAKEDWEQMPQAEKDKIHEWNAAWCLVGPFGAFHGVLCPEVEF